MDARLITQWLQDGYSWADACDLLRKYFAKCESERKLETDRAMGRYTCVLRRGEETRRVGCETAYSAKHQR